MRSKTSYSELHVLNRSIYSFCEGKVVVVLQIMIDCSVYVLHTFSNIQQDTNTVHRIHQCVCVWGGGRRVHAYLFMYVFIYKNIYDRFRSIIDHLSGQI